jgi:two-component system, OmpR family, response regulator VicR
VPKKILLLEDDPNLGSILQEHLHMKGFDVKLCGNGEDGLTVYRREKFDLCLVDVMMPKKDGFTFAREVREEDQETPLIFLTAKSLKEDKIEGFKIGCDDYVTKPFSIEELMFRIEAVLKRSHVRPAADETQTQFSIGAYGFDYTRHILSHGSTQLKLTPKESELLRLLCLHMNETVERDYALRTIWGNESYFSGRSMDVFVSKLRKYLKDDSHIEIMGIHGKGIRLVVS